MFSFLNNIPAVTKNILILNVLFFFASIVMIQNGFESLDILGGHYVGSPFFKPYQVITHFFMHAPNDIFHILFNMILLVMLGSHLERLWGPKRFFIFYIISALGSFLLFSGIGTYQIMELKQELINQGYDPSELYNHIAANHGREFIYFPDSPEISSTMIAYQAKISSSMVGASGAIFGIMAAFAYLFPNTEFMLLFPPIPVKAKYFVGIYFIVEVYLGFQNRAGDNVAHFAHVGGAVAGFVMVYIWNRKRDRFY